MSRQQEAQWRPAHPCGAALETELLQEKRLPGGPLPASPRLSPSLPTLCCFWGMLEVVGMSWLPPGMRGAAEESGTGCLETPLLPLFSHPSDSSCFSG